MTIQRDPRRTTHAHRPTSGGPHAEWFELVSAAADGELDESESARLAAHLATCTPCTTLLADLEATRRRHRFRPARAPAHLVGEVHEARSRQRASDHRTRTVLTRTAATAAGAAALAAIAVSLAAGPQSSAPELSSESSRQRIGVTDRAFDEAAITIEAGTTVEWLNRGSATHQLVRVLGGVTVDEVLPPGGRESARFDRAGTFRYYCAVHSEMSGTVTVEG